MSIILITILLVLANILGYFYYKNPQDEKKLKRGLIIAAIVLLVYVGIDAYIEGHPVGLTVLYLVQLLLLFVAYGYVGFYGLTWTKKFSDLEWYQMSLYFLGVLLYIVMIFFYGSLVSFYLG